MITHHANQVTVSGGKSYEGEVYGTDILFFSFPQNENADIYSLHDHPAIDPHSKSLALKTDKGTFAIINPSQITNIQGDLAAIKTPELEELNIK